MSDYFSFARVVQYFPKIISRFPTTLLIVAVAILVGIVFGIVLAFIRINKVPVLSQLVKVYVSFIRGTPLVVQLFIIYYGVPAFAQALFGLDLNRVDSIYFVFVAYGMSESAYLSELFRGGLEAIPIGQYEAGYTIGLTKIQTFYRVILPQTIRIIIPGFGVELISLFQGTSLAATIGVVDLMGKAGLMGAATYHYTENYFCTAVIFIVVSLLLELVFQRLSRRFSYQR